MPDKQQIQALPSPILLNGMASAKCAGGFQCLIFVLSTRPRTSETARIDLELATEHYRFKNIAQKVRAGFSIYARAQDVPNLRRVLEQREITAEILSL